VLGKCQFILDHIDSQSIFSIQIQHEENYVIVPPELRIATELVFGASVGGILGARLSTSVIETHHLVLHKGGCMMLE